MQLLALLKKTPQQTILVCGSVLGFCKSTDVINDIRDGKQSGFFFFSLPPTLGADKGLQSMGYF